MSNPITPGKDSPGNNRDLAVVLIFLIGLAFVYHLGLAWHGHGHYRDQHLGTALHYAATELSLKDTIIAGFNATGTPTIQEVPVWQMAAGLMFKVFGTWWGWANIVSLVLFMSCLYPLHQIVKTFYGERAAWWALLFFLSQGLIFLYAGEAGTDGFSLSSAIWFWFAACKLMESPVKWFLPAAALGTLAALTKLPFFMATGLAAFFLMLKVRGLKVRELAALAGVGGIAGVAFLLWTHYTDSLQAGAEFPYVDLRLNSPPSNGMTMAFWYFGDWHYRLNPANWARAAWRFASADFGSFSLIPLFIWALISRWPHTAAKFFLAGSFLTTLVFSHLILHHYNYLMLYSPAVAILGAVGWERIEDRLRKSGVQTCFSTCIPVVVLLLALFQGLINARAFTFDGFPAMITNAIRDHTTPEDRLVVLNGGWGGDELIRAGRNGLSMWDAKAFEDPAKYARLKQLGFDKMVILSESPYQNAIEIVNPGQTGITRSMAKSFVTPLVASWPTVYQTDDIIIKEIR